MAPANACFKTKRILSLCEIVLAAFVLLVLSVLAMPRVASADEGVTRIHVLPFAGGSLDLSCAGGDAIIIESNGRFGMVDSGESSDYPDGSNPRYPFRAGTTIGHGVEDRVLSYLDSLGVTEDNFDFYIGTHPHSDHIGNAGLIIRKYKPSRVYTPRYDDSYLTSSWGLWDNQYVYDDLVNAAKEVGADLYLDFDEAAPESPEPGSNVCRPEFDFGNAHIELVNTDSSYETAGVADANYISLGAKVTSGGKVAYLAGDICNSDGDEDRLAQTLGHIDFMKLGHHGGPNSNTPDYMATLSPEIVFQTGVYNLLWDQTLNALEGIRPLFFNCDDCIAANEPAFVVDLDPNGIGINMDPAPKTIWHNSYAGCYVAFEGNRPGAVQEGWQRVTDGFVFFDHSSRSLRNSWIKEGSSYSYVGDDSLRVTGWQSIDGVWYYFDADGIMQTGWDLIDGAWYWFDSSGAMVTGVRRIDGQYSEFSSDGRWVGYVSLRPGWSLINDAWYYVSDGSLATGWQKVGDSWYWFDETGKMVVGWRRIDGAWYYLEDSGAMATGWDYIAGAWYWFESSGAMQTGWNQIGSNWYLLSESGAMKTGWVLESGSWYYLDPASGAMSTGWLQDGANWYYIAANGAMRSSCWIGNYYVLDSGAMARNQWVGQYYVGADGLWDGRS